MNLNIGANKNDFYYITNNNFYNVFGMTQTLTGGLNPGHPALDASTIPLGYRGGGRITLKAGKFVNILVFFGASDYFTDRG